MRNWLPFLLVGFATFFWGSTFILVKATIAIIPVNYFLLLRFAIATILALPVIIYRNQLINKTIWIKGSVLGTLLFASYYFQTIGLLYTTPAKAAFITGLSVVIIPILGYGFLNTPITKEETTAVLLSLGGTLLLTISFSNITQINWGDVIILLTALSIALHILYAERSVDVSIIELLWVQFAIMTIWAAIFAGFSQTPEIIWYQSEIVVFTLIITVLFATIFAFGAQFYAQQQNVRATHIGLLFALEPVFALLIDILVGTIPTTSAMIGMVLILCAIIIVTVQQNKINPQPSNL